ncbi:MAG: hypothetical protein VW397_04605 [Candidatus Margulisiibacteriota bacterium]
MNKIISCRSHNIILLTAEDVPKYLAVFLDFVFQDKFVQKNNLVQSYYQQLFFIILNWAYVTPEQLNLKTVQVFKMPEKMAGPKTFYVGDIHGEMNHLLFNLIGSGLFEYQPSKVPYLLYDPLKRKAYSILKLPKYTNKAVDHFQLIPNLRFVLNSNVKMVILGDILDRGPFMDQCLSLILYLIDQQKVLLSTGGMPEKQLVVLLGDHEIYGLRPEAMLFPNYQLTVGIPFSIRRSNQHNISFVHKILSQAFQNGEIQYAYYGVNQEYAAHSAITETFLLGLVDSFNNLNYRLLNQRLDLVQRLEFINNVNALLNELNGPVYLERIILFLNILFKELACLLAPNSGISYLDRLIFFRHPLISISDGSHNPLWVRPFADPKIKCVDSMGVIGHSSICSGECQVLNQANSKVISVDIQASWIYRSNQERPHSRARLTFWDSKKNKFFHLRLSNEITCFRHGGFKPNSNQSGWFKRIVKLFPFLPITNSNLLGGEQ